MEDKTKCKDKCNNYNTVIKITEKQSYKQNKHFKYNESKIQKSDKSGKEYKCERCRTIHGSKSSHAYCEECNACSRLGHFKICYSTLKAHTLNEQKPETSDVQFTIDSLKTEVIDNIKAV